MRPLNSYAVRLTSHPTWPRHIPQTRSEFVALARPPSEFLFQNHTLGAFAVTEVPHSSSRAGCHALGHFPSVAARPFNALRPSVASPAAQRPARSPHSSTAQNLHAAHPHGLRPRGVRRVWLHCRPFLSTAHGGCVVVLRRSAHAHVAGQAIVARRSGFAVALLPNRVSRQPNPSLQRPLNSYAVRLTSHPP